MKTEKLLYLVTEYAPNGEIFGESQTLFHIELFFSLLAILNIICPSYPLLVLS